MNGSHRWYAYILQCSDATYYTGITTDLSRRVLEHNTSDKGAKYTRSRRPVVLAYAKEVENKSEASREEYRIKRLTRSKKEALIADWKPGV